MQDLYENAIASLSLIPGTLTAWLGEMPDSLILRRERDDAWHTVDILKHLIHGEQTDWIPRLKLMVKHRHDTPPTFESFDREGHRHIADQSTGALLEQFARLRSANLQELNTIAKQWPLDSLMAIHPELGPVNGKHLVATWATHDQTHVYQIARNITSAFAGDVGPWRHYLRIVNQNRRE